METRENPTPDADLTKTETVEYDGDVLEGTLTIEYKPRGVVLAEGSAETWLAAEEDLPVLPEEFLTVFVGALIDTLYPGYESRDNPLQYVPLSVTFEYTMAAADGDGAGTVSLGSAF